MEPKTLGEHQKLLTEVIKKQIVILGPDITLAKARNVQGLTIADDGTVTAINGDPQLLTKELVNQFMELSGLIVKKTMEPLLAISSDSTPSAGSPIPTTPTPTPATPATSNPTPPPPASTPPVANPTENMPQSNQQSETQKISNS